MDDGWAEARRRKYLSLGLGEISAAVTFLLVGWLAVTPRLGELTDKIALWAALMPLLFVLVAAGGYWLLARDWVGQSPMPFQIAVLFRVIEAMAAGLLLSSLVGILIWLPAGVGWRLFVLAIWLFGVLEFVNYFVVRLAYPLGQWTSGIRQRRTPQLVLDMRAAR